MKPELVCLFVFRYTCDLHSPKYAYFLRDQKPQMPARSGTKASSFTGAEISMSEPLGFRWNQGWSQWNETFCEFLVLRFRTSALQRERHSQGDSSAHSDGPVLYSKRTNSRIVERFAWAESIIVPTAAPWENPLAFLFGAPCVWGPGKGIPKLFWMVLAAGSVYPGYYHHKGPGTQQLFKGAKSLSLTQGRGIPHIQYQASHLIYHHTEYAQPHPSDRILQALCKGASALPLMLRVQFTWMLLYMHRKEANEPKL